MTLCAHQVSLEYCGRERLFLRVGVGIELAEKHWRGLD